MIFGSLAGSRALDMRDELGAEKLVQRPYCPIITQAILDGHPPRDLTAEKLLEHSHLPLAWHDQRTALGFA
jgi:hypothetical protein